MTPPDPSEVRDGLIAGREGAVECVREWVAEMVRRWRLEDAEAAVQEITMKIVHLAGAGRIKPDHDFRGFVATVTRHACIDLYRKERLRETVESPLAVTDAAADCAGPHERLENEERYALLRFAYQAMSPECRELWNLIYGAGMSAAEAGEKLGLTANAIRVRAHRCLARAREIRRRFFPDGAGGSR